MNTFVKADSLAGVFNTYVQGTNTYYDITSLAQSTIGTIDSKSVVFIQANIADAGKFIDSYQVQAGDTFIWTHNVIYAKPFSAGENTLEHDITPDVSVGFVDAGDTSKLRAGMTLQQCMEAIFVGEYKYICGNFTANISVNQPIITLSVQRCVDVPNDVWEEIPNGSTVPLGIAIRYKAVLTPSSAIAGPLYMGKNISVGILGNGYWKGNYTTTEIDTTSADYGSASYSDSTKTTLSDSGSEDLTILSNTNAFLSATPQNIVADWVSGTVGATNELSLSYGGKTYTVNVNADTTIYAVSSKKMIYNTGDYYRTILNGTQLATSSPTANKLFTLTGEAASYYYWGSDGTDDTTIQAAVVSGFDSSTVSNFVRYTTPLNSTALNGFLYILTPKAANKIHMLDFMNIDMFSNPSYYSILKSNVVDSEGIAYNLYRFPKNILNPEECSSYSLNIE